MKTGCSQKSYLDGDAKVVPIFYFWDEMLNPAGDLQQNRQFNFKAPRTLKPRTFPTEISLTEMMVSLKSTISGLTLSSSSATFSFPLIKPHFGAEGNKEVISDICLYMYGCHTKRQHITFLLLLLLIVFVLIGLHFLSDEMYTVRNGSFVSFFWCSVICSEAPNNVLWMG